MRQKWRSWRSLTPQQQRTVFVAWVCLPGLVTALRVAGYRRVQIWLTRTAQPGRHRHDPQPLQTGLALARAVEIAAANSVLPVKCLGRSLMLWWLLRRRGVTAELRVGVRKETGQFEAHAWVEYAGTVLNDRQDVPQRFAPFAGDFSTLPMIGV